MNQNEDLTNDRADVYSRPSAYFDGDGALVVRASAASGCRRALWYAATEWQPTNPPSDESLTVMEAGQALEQVVLWAMERGELGRDPRGPQQPQGGDGPDHPQPPRVTGHPDATARPPLIRRAGGDRRSQDQGAGRLQALANPLARSGVTPSRWPRPPSTPTGAMGKPATW